MKLRVIQGLKKGWGGGWGGLRDLCFQDTLFSSVGLVDYVVGPVI